MALSLPPPGLFAGTPGGAVGRFMLADEYLTYARECRRWALETRDQAAREAFLEMGRVWTQLGLQQQGLSSLVQDPPQLQAS